MRTCFHQLILHLIIGIMGYDANLFPLVVFVEESVGVVPVKHVEHR